MEGVRTKNQRGILVLSGKPADAVQMIASESATWRSIGATVLLPLDLSYSAQAYAALGKFDDAWRCIGEAMTKSETTKERVWEAEIHRIAGEIALLSPERDAAKEKGVLSLRSRLRVSSKQNPGNCAQQ